MNKQIFLSSIKKNKTHLLILERLPKLQIPDLWLVAGSLFQSVWNDLTDKPIDYGIRDYDLFYFDDSDLSWEAEDKVINEVKTLFSDISENIEIRKS